MEPTDVYRVVQFETLATSVELQHERGTTSKLTTCPFSQSSKPICFDASAPSLSVTLSYDVAFDESTLAGRGGGLSMGSSAQDEPRAEAFSIS